MNTAAATTNGGSATGASVSDLKQRRGADTDVSSQEQRVLDRIAEALARLSRVKRVGLAMQDKAAFIAALNGKK